LAQSAPRAQRPGRPTRHARTSPRAATGMPRRHTQSLGDPGDLGGDPACTASDPTGEAGGGVPGAEGGGGRACLVKKSFRRGTASCRCPMQGAPCRHPGMARQRTRGWRTFMYATRSVAATCSSSRPRRVGVRVGVEACSASVPAMIMVVSPKATSRCTNLVRTRSG
jgi:hypothetical protein